MASVLIATSLIASILVPTALRLGPETSWLCVAFGLTLAAISGTIRSASVLTSDADIRRRYGLGQARGRPATFAGVEAAALRCHGVTSVVVFDDPSSVPYTAAVFACGGDEDEIRIAVADELPAGVVTMVCVRSVI